MKLDFDRADWDVSELADRLRATFLDFLVAEAVEDETKVIQPWIEAAVRSVRAGHRRYVHYIPCVALELGDQTSYDFGSITFKHKHLFWEEFSR